MKIRSFPALLTVASGLVALALPAQAQSRAAYLEVVPFTIQWTRSTSAITRSRTSEGATSTDPVALITTDTVKPLADLGPTGSYTDFLAQIRQGVGVQGGVDWNFQGDRNIIVDLVAVRAPARSVDEFATNPYYIFLTATDRRTRTYPFTPVLVDDYSDPSGTPVSTGLTLSFGEYFGRTKEIFDVNGNLYSASGTVSTSFKVDYSTSWYPSAPSLLPRHMFLMTARGTAIYTIRTVKLNTDVGTPAFLAPSAATLRGIGYHAHDYLESVTDITKNYTHLGLAPVSIVLGTAKYVSRERFPDFEIPADPSGLTATANSDSQISLQWLDTSDNEIGFQVERRLGNSGAWSKIAVVAPNTMTYVDSNLAASTAYSYRVRAGNRFSFSDYTSPASATTLALP